MLGGLFARFSKSGRIAVSHRLSEIVSLESQLQSQHQTNVQNPVASESEQ
jgi:hypothetical protein